MPRVRAGTGRREPRAGRQRRRDDLLLGLYVGAVVGSGVTGVTLEVTVDGDQVSSLSFTSGAAAKSYFTDHPVDLGSLTSGSLSLDSLSATVTLSVTTSQSGSGFYGDLVLGDPPTGGGAGMSSAAQRLASAMATFGSARGAASIHGFGTSGGEGAGMRLARPLLRAA